METTITRRNALAGLAALLAGCASTRAAAPEPAATYTNTETTTEPGTAALPPTVAPFHAAMADLALVSADGRVAVLRNGVFGEPADGLIASDGRTLVATTIASASTMVTWLDLGDSATVATATVAGHLRAIATDRSGGVVALTGSNPEVVNGTEIVAVGHDGVIFRRRYDTELLPEGFAAVTDENGLPIGMFVQEFLDPPDPDRQAPRWYQVRVLDLATGELSLPFNLRDKSQQVDEQMLGFGRTRVQSDVNGLLFTLYRGIYEDSSDGVSSEYAFVHTLGFFNGVWCLDLPRELSLEWESGALGLIDGERSLLVVSSNGFVSEFRIGDITEFTDDVAAMPAARRTAKVWTPPASADGPAVATSPAGIVIGQGTTLRWIDPDTLAETTSLDWDLRIESVHILGNESSDVIAVGSGRAAQIRPKGGDLVAEVPLPSGFGGITRIVELPS
ncbi:MAG: hypothetical protein ABIR32_17660 [Ilumatobacteraceae bacterium]